MNDDFVKLLVAAIAALWAANNGGAIAVIRHLVKQLEARDKTIEAQNASNLETNRTLNRTINAFLDREQRKDPAP